jgi:GrpB-like predicted nucleotidyltransferase (UPF0157 family)
MSVLKLYKYSNSFPELFKIEKARILSVSNVNDIHHIGSTAVEGLDGKGVIDIMIGVENTEKALEIEQDLIQLGYMRYNYVAEGGVWIFLKNKAETSIGDFHVHIIDKRSDDYAEDLSFRDYLRTNKRAVQDYVSAKQYILEQAKDRIEYMQLKSIYIRKVLSQIVEQS